MEINGVVVALLLAVGGLGIALGYWWGRGAGARDQRLRHGDEVAGLRRERDLLTSRVGALEEERDREGDLGLAIAPLSSGLARMERHVESLERARAQQLGQLSARLDAVVAAEEGLRRQTAALAGALSAPTVRGAWGEVQLRRVVEHAGMLARVDFEEQVQVTLDDGSAVRPDAVVRLPGGKNVVVDAKAPLAAFLEAARELGDEETEQAARRRRRAAEAHAAALRRHVDQLAAKEYWRAFEPTPELVVCFVPGEGFLAAACDADPALLEHAMARKVVLATPMSLLMLLRTVAAAWQQDALTGSARELLVVAKELYGRLGGLAGQMSRLGRSLDRAVVDYNATIGTLERRVLVSARRMHGLGIGEAPVDSPTGLESDTRLFTAPELVLDPSEHLR